MQAPTYTKTGNKATSSVRLNKAIFGLDFTSHQLLKTAYDTYLANARVNLAKTKTRGKVRGGGRKPWRQKGTGRARFGSIRVPLWRGGGITFGPTGQENYSKKLNPRAKRLAIRQALSLAARDEKLKIVENLPALEGKTKDIAQFLKKINADKRSLLILEAQKSKQAANNLPNLKVLSANYLNVFDILNADAVIIERAALDLIDKWLGTKK